MENKKEVFGGISASWVDEDNLQKSPYVLKKKDIKALKRYRDNLGVTVLEVYAKFWANEIMGELFFLAVLVGGIFLGGSLLVNVGLEFLNFSAVEPIYFGFEDSPVFDFMVLTIPVYVVLFSPLIAFAYHETSLRDVLGAFWEREDYFDGLDARHFVRKAQLNLTKVSHDELANYIRTVAKQGRMILWVDYYWLLRIERARKQEEEAKRIATKNRQEKAYKKQLKKDFKALKDSEDPVADLMRGQ